MTKTLLFDRYFDLMQRIVNYRIRGIVAAKDLTLAPWEVEELIDEATCQLVNHVPDDVDDGPCDCQRLRSPHTMADHIARIAAYRAARCTMSGSRLCADRGTTSVRAENNLTYLRETVVHPTETYDGPDIMELIDGLQGSPRVVAILLALGNAKTTIARHIGRTPKTVHRICAKIRENLCHKVA